MRSRDRQGFKLPAGTSALSERGGARGAIARLGRALARERRRGSAVGRISPLAESHRGRAAAEAGEAGAARWSVCGGRAFPRLAGARGARERCRISEPASGQRTGQGASGTVGGCKRHKTSEAHAAVGVPSGLPLPVDAASAPDGRAGFRVLPASFCGSRSARPAFVRVASAAGRSNSQPARKTQVF